MPDRTTKVTLTADATGYVAGMDKAASATKKMTDEAAQKLAKHQAAMTEVGTGALAMGAVVGAGVALAVKKFADFDQAMSFVDAAMHETSKNMGLLRDAAIEAGARTVFSATEAANAIEELGKAGISTKDILAGGLNGALDLAAAGGLGVADAAGIAATALQQFGLQGKDMGHVADLLSAGAGKAMGSVEDLSAGLKFVGPVAKGMGVSIDETVGVLAEFASQGILADQAGTGLRGMLSSLTSPSQSAADELDALGVQLYDGQGKFLGLANMAGQLQAAYKGMTDQQKDTSLGIIFGNQQITAARVILDQGRDGVEKWTKAVNDQGFAADTARRRLDNLSGDIEQLGGSIDTALIQTGSSANGALRALTQDVTKFINSIGQVPTPVLAVGLGLAGLVAATTLVGGAFFVAVPKLASFRLALADMGPVAQRTGVALGAVSKAAGAVAVVATAIEGLSLLAHTMDTASASAEDLQNALKVGGSGAKTFATALKGLDAFTLSHYADNWGKYVDVISRSPDNRWLPGFTHDLFALAPEEDKARDGLAALGKEISTLDPSRASDAFQNMVKEMGGGRKAASELLDLMPDYKNALIEQATAQGISTEGMSDAQRMQVLLKLALGGSKDATEDNSAALAEMSNKAQDANGDISDLAKAILDFGKGQLDVNSAERDFQAAIDDLTKSVHDNGHSLDIGAEKGRNNQEALDNIAKSALGAASAILTQTGSQEDATAAVQAGRDALIKALGQFNITGKAADDYANKLGLIPGNVSTTLALQTDPATRELNDWLARNAHHQVHIAMGVGGAGGLTRANGGILPGSPSSRDNMMIAAASGEFITRASQTAIPENRRALEYINNGGVIPGYASGGMVGFTPAPVYTPAPPRMYMPEPGASQGAGPTINMPIYAAPGMSAETVGRIAADQFNWELRGA